VLLQKSLERNPTHGSAQILLVAALSLTGQHSEAASMALIPPTISRIPRICLPAVLVIAFGFRGLSRPGVPLIREHPSAQRSMMRFSARFQWGRGLIDFKRV